MLSSTPMRSFLQGRMDFVQELRSSSLGFTQQDLGLILTAVITACAAYRWPGKGFDQKRFVETLIRFSSPSLHMNYISTGGLLESGSISESETPWRDLDARSRIFIGAEIDAALPDMANRYPQLTTRDLKQASYANLIYRWLRCGYAHTYWAFGNTTHVPPSLRPAQISYVGRLQPDGSWTRIASFHLDYLIQAAQEQVSSLPEKPPKEPKPDEWWIDMA